MTQLYGRNVAITSRIPSVSDTTSKLERTTEEIIAAYWEKRKNNPFMASSTSQKYSTLKVHSEMYM
ncbi:MAG: hypothetical protein PHU51_02470 [Candidatus Nanoarchaeia archaeon]|nr:hypothetical protein [Candidatus Nanoarchaeia archaeon]